MKVLKVILINASLAGALGLISLILFSQYLKKYPPAPSAPKAMGSYSDQEAVRQFGPGILQPFPESVRTSFSKELQSLIGDNTEVRKNYPYNYYHLAFLGERSFHVTATFKNQILYEVDYHFDSFGRRRVSESPKSSADRFVLAFGCSFTLGEGVDSGLDFPSQLNQKIGPEWSVYNFGFHGFSPASAFSRAKTYPRYLQGIKEDSGVFIWSFIESHLTRNFCDLDCYNPRNEWLRRGPEVEKINGKFKVLGSFKDSRKLWRQGLEYLFRQPLLNGLRFGAPAYSDSQIDDFFELLDEIAKATKKRMTKKYFVIFDSLYPRTLRQIQNSAQKFNFEIIYFQPLMNRIPKDQVRIPVDGHPTAATYWLLSEVLKGKILKDANP